VEAYNIKSNEWFHVAPMNTRRSSVGVGVVGGRYPSILQVHWLLDEETSSSVI
jgi:hypothetical protein